MKSDDSRVITLQPKLSRVEPSLHPEDDSREFDTQRLGSGEPIAPATISPSEASDNSTSWQNSAAGAAPAAEDATEGQQDKEIDGYDFGAHTMPPGQRAKLLNAKLPEVPADQLYSPRRAAQQTLAAERERRRRALVLLIAAVAGVAVLIAVSWQWTRRPADGGDARVIAPQPTTNVINAARPVRALSPPPEPAAPAASAPSASREPALPSPGPSARVGPSSRVRSKSASSSLKHTSPRAERVLEPMPAELIVPDLPSAAASTSAPASPARPLSRETRFFPPEQ